MLSGTPKGTGQTPTKQNSWGHVCSDGEVLVGYSAAARSDHNPTNTLYDAKRFIGKTFSREELETEAARYPFQASWFQHRWGLNLVAMLGKGKRRVRELFRMLRKDLQARIHVWRAKNVLPVQ